MALRWRQNDHPGVSKYQPHDCLLNCWFGRTSEKTSKLRVTGLCAGNSPVTGEFPAQMASNAENVSIWWRRYGWYVRYVSMFVWCLLRFYIRGAMLGHLSLASTVVPLRTDREPFGKKNNIIEFPAQKASNAENVSIWGRHHEYRGVRAFNFVRLSISVFMVWVENRAWIHTITAISHESQGVSNH